MGHGTRTRYDRRREVPAQRPTGALKRVASGAEDGHPLGNAVYLRKLQKEHDAYTDALREEGADVIRIPGSQLSIGGGGPRSTTRLVLEGIRWI